jgi:hypothetical protein
LNSGLIDILSIIFINIISSMMYKVLARRA